MQTVAVEFGREEEAKQVVTEVVASFGDSSIKVRVQLLPASLPNFLILGDALKCYVDELAE